MSPGNQLAHRNARKSWAIYWSLLQFGLPVLSDEDGWFCCAAERTDSLALVNGGIGQTFTCILKFMLAQHGHTLHQSGVVLDFPNGMSERIFIALGMVIQVGAYHNLTITPNGAYSEQ